jgi:hypothetical protein
MLVRGRLNFTPHLLADGHGDCRCLVERPLPQLLVASDKVPRGLLPFRTRPYLPRPGPEIPWPTPGLWYELTPLPMSSFKSSGPDIPMPAKSLDLPLLLVIGIFKGVIAIDRRSSRSRGLWVLVFRVRLLDIAV